MPSVPKVIHMFLVDTHVCLYVHVCKALKDTLHYNVGNNVGYKCVFVGKANNSWRD